MPYEAQPAGLSPETKSTGNYGKNLDMGNTGGSLIFTDLSKKANKRLEAASRFLSTDDKIGQWAPLKFTNQHVISRSIQTKAEMSKNDKLANFFTSAITPATQQFLCFQSKFYFVV